MKKNTKAFLAGTIGAMGLLLGSSQVASANTTVKVKSGDTVWNFAKKYGVSIQSIEKLNKVSADSHLIYVNQSLEIPTDGNQAEEKTTTPAPTATGTYTVQAGDSLWTIAQKYNTTVDALAQLNGLNLNSLLHVGQSLKVTGTATASATQAATQTTASQATAQTATTSQATTSYNTQAAAQPAQTNQAATTQTYANNGSVVSIANRYLGTPYAWGGTTPQGFDCSGFTQYVYGQAGKSIGRNTVAQESAGSQIPVSQAQPGDLLFWGSRGSSYHVAIYAGNGRYIAAPTEGQSVSYGNTAYYTPSFAVHVN